MYLLLIIDIIHSKLRMWRNVKLIARVFLCDVGMWCCDVQEHAVDPVTRLILYKLVNGGLLESVDGIVSSGKESVVFHATGATGYYAD